MWFWKKGVAATVKANIWAAQTFLKSIFSVVLVIWSLETVSTLAKADHSLRDYANTVISTTVQGLRKLRCQLGAPRFHSVMFFALSSELMSRHQQS